MLARSSIATLLLLLGLVGCTDTPEVTGIRLTMHYGANTPDKLRVVGTTLEGRAFGPSLLPDPPRPLEPNRESVLLQLPESMDGVVLAISVAGLDQGHEPRLRGTVQTEVVRNKVQTLLVVLTGDPECPSGTRLSLEGDCIRTRPVSELPDDAGNGHVDAGVDAGMDASTDESGDASLSDATIDAGLLPADACADELCVDAALIDAAAPDAAVVPPPPPPPPPPPAITELSCGAGTKCNLACPPGAECEIYCGDVSECKVRCGAGSRCVVECHSEECTLQCEGNGRANACSENTMVCNRECP